VEKTTDLIFPEATGGLLVLEKRRAFEEDQVTYTSDASQLDAFDHMGYNVAQETETPRYA
jgi:hypothetical protein